MGKRKRKIIETPETMALAEFDVTEAALAEIKEYERLRDSRTASEVERPSRAVV